MSNPARCRVIRLDGVQPFVADNQRNNTINRLVFIVNMGGTNPALICHDEEHHFSMPISQERKDLYMLKSPSCGTLSLMAWVMVSRLLICNCLRFSSFSSFSSMINSLVKSKILFGVHKLNKFYPQFLDYLTRVGKSSMNGIGICSYIHMVRFAALNAMFISFD